MNIPDTFFLSTAASLHLLTGKVECACTTSECARDGTTACRADNFCYVQIIPPVSASASSGTMTATSHGGDVSRGCIDEDTPLLCENKRPSTYRGVWPVLLCCSVDWCNGHVLPTLPPWASHVEGCSLLLVIDGETLRIHFQMLRLR